MAVDPTQSPLFTQLASKYGVGVALQFLRLFNPDASAGSKAVGGLNLAGAGTKVAADLGSATAKTAAPYLRGAATGAGLGLSLADIAKNENLSFRRKAGHATESGFVAGTSFIPVAGPIIVASRLGDALGNQLQRSNSPQVQGAGRAIGQAARPAGERAFWDVIRGDRSIKGALSNAGPEGFVTDLLGPVGALLKGLGIDRKVSRNIMDFGPIPGGGKLASMLGIGSKPTTGTDFRREIRSLFDQSPTLKGTDTSKYDMVGGVDAYNAFSPQARAQAEGLARQLGSLSPTFAKQDPTRQQAYVGQIANILLNRFGSSGIPGLKL